MQLEENIEGPNSQGYNIGMQHKFYQFLEKNIHPNYWINRSTINVSHLQTSCVNVLTGIPNALANPKSASFSALLRRSINKFCGFKSR